MGDFPLFLTFIIGMGIVQILVIYVLIRTFVTALNARRTGLNLTTLDVMMMDLRRIDTRTLVNAHGIAHTAGLALPLERLLAWQRERIPLTRLVTALVQARKAKLAIDVDQLATRARDGLDPVNEVERMLSTRT